MYTSVQYSSLVTALSVRLSDVNFAFWTQNEVMSYIDEAIRTWQAYSAAYNIRVIVPTAANTLFYDLFQLVPELAPSIQDVDLVRDISFALQEPFNFATQRWIGTEQFSEADVFQSLNQRRNKFFLETGLVLKNVEIPGPTVPANTLVLPQDVIDIRNMLWKDDTNLYSLMWRLDPFTAASKPVLLPGTPSDYATYPMQPQVATLYPPPINNGMTNLLVIESLPDLVPGSPVILGIPDDFCWVLKYGALADLYASDGPGQDDQRAAYCEKRWTDGILLARISNIIHLGQNAGNPEYVDSLFELNSGDPLWPSKPTGPPDILAVAGNIIATSPVSDVSYSLAFDIQAKAPISHTGVVQIGPETVAVILDLAQHLADVKEGAEELQNSSRQYSNMVKLASVTNDRLRAQAQNFDVLNSRSKRFSKEHPRRISQLGMKELDYDEK